MTRVLHLTRDWPPRHCGGISTAVAGLVEASRASGLACAVASFDEYRPGAAPTDEARPRPARGELLRIDDERDLQRLDAFARDFAPDVIQLHVDLLWEVAAGLRRRLDVPIVATLHVCHRQMLRVLGAERASASLAAQEQALRAADVLAAPTTAAAGAILGDDEGVAGRLHVAGFTVDPSPVATLDAPRLVSVGRFGAVKGTDRLIELLPYLLAEPTLELDIVGGLPRNPQRDRRWRRKITEAAGPHADRVRLHGWLDPPARDAVLRTTRALLSTSRIETFGLAALEALAHGVPVCGYREPALAETAPDQLWLADGDPHEVAGSVIELVRDVERCREHGRAGRAAIPSWPSVIDAWRAVYAAATGVR